MPAEGFGVGRPTELPDKMDVLIVGSGPAGSITAAQLSQFPNVNTRMIEQRGHRLELANADGVHSRTMETFKAFRSEEHTSELQSRGQLVCRLLLEKKRL